ncbi:MAG: DNA-binding protein Alba [Candidatus Ranarchaeia archaeon]
MNAHETKENVILVGRKDLMSYVLSTVSALNQGADIVSIKARGRAISRAVDVAEITRKRFTEDVDLKDIKIGTEPLKTEDGKTINISTIEIILTKAKH